jgi:HPt (histidine-containing phosphotransfer) domain-containing protein
MSTNSVLDPEAIDALRAINPDDGGHFFRELLEVYLNDALKRVEEIEQSIAAGDAAVLTRAAHTLKGSSANFGAHALVAVCRDMEMSGKRGAVAEAAAMVPTLKAEDARVRAAMEQLLRHSPP